MAAREKMPIGVFTSIGEGLGAGLDAVAGLGVPTVQVHAPPIELRTAEHAATVRRQFAEAGIEITLVFCGFPGESYADIPTTQRTVGLVPRETRQERIAQTRQIIDFAAALGAPGIGIHMGFIPEDHGSEDFADLVQVTADLCDTCAERDLIMNLETGQETAAGLLAFLEAVGRPNLGVNFDPANMILYGSGEPIEALRKVGRNVRSCHVKDALWSDQPGKTFGKQVPLDEGQVGMETYIRTLAELGYEGPLTIEREIEVTNEADRQRQIADIRAAIELLHDIKRRLGIAS